MICLERKCKHCGKTECVPAFDANVLYCDECLFHIQRVGDIRVCDCCGKSWDDPELNCGYAVQHPSYKNEIAELCSECEKEYKKFGSIIFNKAFA